MSVGMNNIDYSDSTLSSEHQQNKLTAYLESVLKIPKPQKYQKMINFGKTMSLQEIKRYSAKYYKSFQNERWPEQNKLILIVLVLHFQQARGIKIQFHKIPQQVWDFIADLLNTEKSILIKKWIVLLRCNKKPDWTEEEETILLSLAKESNNWLEITLEIYEHSGNFQLRNQKSTSTRYRQLTTIKNNTPWSAEEDALIYLLFIMNKMKQSSSAQIMQRNQRQVNNRKILIDKLNYKTPQMMQNVFFAMIKLSNKCKMLSSNPSPISLLRCQRSPFVAGQIPPFLPLDLFSSL